MTKKTVYKYKVSWTNSEGKPDYQLFNNYGQALDFQRILVTKGRKVSIMTGRFTTGTR